MKTTLLILLGVLAINPFPIQIDKPAHIKFKSDDKLQKNIISDNGDLDFYLDNLHFYFNALENECITLKVSEVDDIEFLSSDALEDMANQERERVLQRQEDEETISVLFNDKIFKEIYLYDKVNGAEIIRYRVIWVEEIE